jgi:hypothetical protein
MSNTDTRIVRERKKFFISRIRSGLFVASNDEDRESFVSILMDYGTNIEVVYASALYRRHRLYLVYVLVCLYKLMGCDVLHIHSFWHRDRFMRFLMIFWKLYCKLFHKRAIIHGIDTHLADRYYSLWLFYLRYNFKTYVNPKIFIYLTSIISAMVALFYYLVDFFRQMLRF